MCEPSRKAALKRTHSKRSAPGEAFMLRALERRFPPVSGAKTTVLQAKEKRTTVADLPLLSGAGAAPCPRACHEGAQGQQGRHQTTRRPARRAQPAARGRLPRHLRRGMPQGRTPDPLRRAERRAVVYALLERLLSEQAAELLRTL